MSKQHIVFIVADRYRYYVDTAVSVLAANRDYSVEFRSPAEISELVEDYTAAIYVTVHSVVPEIHALFDSVRGRVPTLTLQDGILEHDHCWEREESRSRYRPIRSDVLATFGRRSSELIQAWNPDQSARIVVTGAPRFDMYEGRVDNRESRGPILITGANTPAMTGDQYPIFGQTVLQLLSCCEHLKIGYRLRLPPSVKRLLASQGFKLGHYRHLTGVSSTKDSLFDDLSRASAVITTPSTVALEAMILGRPTALLRWRSATSYLASAWEMRTTDDMLKQLPELLDPPREKIIYQTVIKNENGVADGRATEPVCGLIKSLVEPGRVRSMRERSTGELWFFNADPDGLRPAKTGGSRSVKLIGNHSKAHCGCAAVWQALTNGIKGKGCELAEGENYDVLIVNGEGSMHHGMPNFHKKMEVIKGAIESGKECYLINTVWESNPHMYDDILHEMSGVIARDKLSLLQLVERHGVAARQAIDLSFFAPLGNVEESHDFGCNIVRTDYHDRGVGKFIPLELPELVDSVSVNMKKIDWSALVVALRSASLLVTGRHHGVYAACRARTPFAAIEGNSHKIRGLIASSGVSIPVADSPKEIPYIMKWAMDHRDLYAELFDWMEDQTVSDAIPQLV